MAGGEPTTVYTRVVHAAHTGRGAGWDLEKWDVVAADWRPGMPKPESVPADATYRSGHLDGGVQHWVFARTAPLSDGRCSRCLPEAGK